LTEENAKLATSRRCLGVLVQRPRRRRGQFQGCRCSLDRGSGSCASSHNTVRALCANTVGLPQYRVHLEAFRGGVRREPGEISPLFGLPQPLRSLIHPKHWQRTFHPYLSRNLGLTGGLFSMAFISSLTKVHGFVLEYTSNSRPHCRNSSYS